LIKDYIVDKSNGMLVFCLSGKTTICMENKVHAHCCWGQVGFASVFILQKLLKAFLE